MFHEALKLYHATSEFRQAADTLGGSGVSIGGLAGGSLAFFLATHTLETDEPTLILVEDQNRADELAVDLETFIGSRVRLFPAWESLFLDDSEPDPDTYQDRMGVVGDVVLGQAAGNVIVAPVQALIQPVPPRDSVRDSIVSFEVGEERSPASIAELLASKAHRHVTMVARPGEFSLRGDILDIYPYARLCGPSERDGEPIALRLEFFGDQIDSIREILPNHQRSIKGSETQSLRLSFPDKSTVFRDCFRSEDDLTLADLLAESGRVFIEEMDAVRARASLIFRNVLPREKRAIGDVFWSRVESLSPTRVSSLPSSTSATAGRDLSFQSVERFKGSDADYVLGQMQESIEAGRQMVLLCEGDREIARLKEMFDERQLAKPIFAVGRCHKGFEAPKIGFVFLTSREIFGRQAVRRLKQRRIGEGRAIQSFLELENGDHVVHLIHGVGRYCGIQSFDREGVSQESLVLEFRGGVKIFVPVSKIDLVQKYIGAGDKVPILDKVGGASWERKKDAVEQALLCMASDLLEIQAERQNKPGIAFPPDSDWQRQFEAAFPFEDTPDQVLITEELKRDMESTRPMDRLICGDVGYGKTELAMRAAFKAVEGGKQVAVLVPTTVLAEQHYRNFSTRMSGFPVRIECLSRFRAPAKQKLIVRAAAEGTVDIIVGTHRLLSKDVRFADLGLVVIDEEQRFGVKHKEKLKKFRTEVDMIALSATPIPRTLHMALLGIRDISNLTTPPEGRSPIHTEISRFDRTKVREIIVRELNRQGQVLFIHNRIADLEVFKREIAELVPQARIDIGHGKMGERELEQIMLRFLSRQADVLIATTIVENGIDVPTANTIIISEADRYGLGDLHQLRGRVGRSRTQAFCYLLLPDHRHMNSEARQRLQALVEFSGLGAGFQIAMRDLEIRGAGNLLGKEQSGHIAAVGYDMYCRLLEKCVREISKEDYTEPVAVEVDLAVAGCVPDEFLVGDAAKLEIYRRVSLLKDSEAIDDYRSELRDRYGELPTEVEMLLDVQHMRVLAMSYDVTYIGEEEGNILLRGGEGIARLLDDCPREVAVLDAQTVAVPIYARRRLSAAPLDPGRIFEIVLEWMRTRVFPKISGRRRTTKKSSNQRSRPVA